MSDKYYKNKLENCEICEALAFLYPPMHLVGKLIAKMYTKYKHPAGAIKMFLKSFPKIYIKRTDRCFCHNSKTNAAKFLENFISKFSNIAKVVVIGQVPGSCNCRAKVGAEGVPFKYEVIARGGEGRRSNVSHGCEHVSKFKTTTATKKKRKELQLAKQMFLTHFS